MALKTHKITWDDGTVRYRQLSSDDAKAWQERADDKASSVKAVSEGKPTPRNKS